MSESSSFLRRALSISGFSVCVMCACVYRISALCLPRGLVNCGSWTCPMCETLSSQQCATFFPRSMPQPFRSSWIRPSSAGRRAGVGVSQGLICNLEVIPDEAMGMKLNGKHVLFDQQWGPSPMSNSMSLALASRQSHSKNTLQLR